VCKGAKTTNRSCRGGNEDLAGGIYEKDGRAFLGNHSLKGIEKNHKSRLGPLAGERVAHLVTLASEAVKGFVIKGGRQDT